MKDFWKPRSSLGLTRCLVVIVFLAALATGFWRSARKPTRAVAEPSATIESAATALHHRDPESIAKRTEFHGRTGDHSSGPVPMPADVPARENFGSAWKLEMRPAFAAFKHWTEQYSAANEAGRSALLQTGIELAQARRSELKELIQTDPRLVIASAVPMQVRSQLPTSIRNQLEEYVSGVGELALIGVTPAPGQSLVGKPYFRTASVNGKHYEAFVYGRRDVWQSKVDISLWGVALDQLLAVSESPLRVLESGEVPLPGKPVNEVCPISGRSTPIESSAPLNVENITAVEVAGEVKQLCSPEHVPFYETRLILAEDATGPYPGALVLGSEGDGTSGYPGRVPYAWSHGPKRVLIIRVDFPDAPGPPVNLEGHVVDEDFAVNLFNQPNGVTDVFWSGVRDFFEQGSYGKTTLVIAPTVNGDSPDVSPVYRMPNSMPYYATNLASVLLADAHDAATNGGYNFADYDRIGMVVTYKLPALPGALVGYGGFGSVQGKYFSSYGSYGFWVVAHEIGHNYGLPHANRWRVTDGNPVSAAGTAVEYGDPFSVMGGDGRFGSGLPFFYHFTPWQKSLLQWIPDSAVPNIQWAGTYRVHRFDHPGANMSNALALKIVRDSTRDYWIGFRQAITNNATVTNGAYILWGYRANRRGELLDMTTPNTNSLDAALPIGATFTDLETGISIHPLSKGGSTPDEYLDIQIGFPSRIQWSSANHVFSEESGVATLTLLRTANSNGVVSVNFATTNGTAIAPEDYAATNGTVIWADEDVSPRFVTIPLVADAVGESLETFGVVLSGISGGVICNDDTASVTIPSSSTALVHWMTNSYTFSEADELATLTLLRGGNTNGVISVNFSTADGTASDADDYVATNGMVMWASGDISPRLIIVPLVVDSGGEAAESFGVTLSGVTGGIIVSNPVATVNIRSSLPAFIQWSSNSYVFDEQAGAATLALTRIGDTNGVVSVNFATTSGSAVAPGDYHATNGTVTWARGDLSPKFITVALMQDFVAEDLESFSVGLTGIAGGHLGTPTATVNIVAQPKPHIRWASTNHTAAEQSSAVTLTLVRSNNTNDIVSVDFATVDGTAVAPADYTATNGTLLWGSGDVSPKTLTIPLVQNFEVEGARRFTVSLSGISGGLIAGGAAATVKLPPEAAFISLTLIKDVNAQLNPAGSVSASPEIINVSGIAFFVATDNFHGNALWKSDGAAEGTVLLRTGSAYNLASAGGTLFFVVNDPDSGAELWKSDGTPDGTVLVKDIRAGTASSSPASLVEANGTLFFSANDGTNGVELWRSDGTAEGTALIKDIRAGGPSSTPTLLTATADGTLFFTANDGVTGIQLWKSDGTGSGTVQVSSINPDAVNSLDNLETASNAIFFTANDGTHGIELWRSDGSSNGTVMVRDIRANASSSSPANLAYVNGRLFFAANDGTNGVELWKTDGSEAGTEMVRNLRPGNGSASPANLINVNGTLYFSAHNGTSGIELWRSDGSSNGTVMVKDIRLGASGSSPANLIEVNNHLLFTADDGTNGVELWISDGTTNGTILVKSIHAGSGSAAPASLVNADGVLFFRADNGTNGVELWRSNGTESGTAMVKDIEGGTLASSPASLAAVNGTLFFAANDGISGVELWQSDGTPGGTVLVRDIHAGTSSSNPTNLTDVNGALFFSATTSANGNELWRSDGTSNGTFLVKDIRASSASSSPASLTEMSGFVFFSANDGTNGAELWRSDGTSNGTVMVQNLRAGSASSSPAHLAAVNGMLFFAANDGTNGVELWKSDGTADGTALLRNIQSGSSSSTPANLVNVNGTLFFTADTSTSGRELWKSDGTSNGTVMVKDLAPGSSDSGPANLTALNGRLFFTADDNVYGRELWTSDGTGNGTVMLTDINAIGGSNPTNLTVFDGRLFFLADDGVHGQELWASDGTELGTFHLNDLPGDPAHTIPSQLVAAGRTLFFSAARINVGEELLGLFLDDYGDAPDHVPSTAVNYPTRLASGGARHLIPTTGPAIYLGTDPPSGGLDALPDSTASADPDEDGVALPATLNSAQTQTVTVAVTGSGGVLNAWVDWNRDGDWNDAGEQVFTNQAAAAGTNHLSIVVPTLSSSGDSFARFRLSTAADLAPTGAALDGEVEDYEVTLSVNLPPAVLRIGQIGENTFAITVNGPPNQTNRIEFTDKLDSPTGTVWKTLGTVELNSQGVGTITNAPAAGTRFYRTVFP